MAQKLKIAVNPTFSAPVVLRLAGDGGKVEEITFNAVFRRLTKTENEKLQTQLDGKSITDSALLDLVLADWTGLQADDGTPFICKPENRAAAVDDWPTFEAAIVYSYFEHAFPAAVKN